MPYFSSSGGTWPKMEYFFKNESLNRFQLVLGGHKNMSVKDLNGFFESDNFSCFLATLGHQKQHFYVE